MNETRELARRGAEPHLVKGSLKDVIVQGYTGQEFQLSVAVETLDKRVIEDQRRNRKVREVYAELPTFPSPMVTLKRPHQCDRLAGFDKGTEP